MRIDRLDLWRFGKFTDKTIDFGKHRKDQPDLHVVYGPNEAGKSTLMAAYLDFLFGFHPQTPYNFKHANNVLKVGAVLSLGDQTQEYCRLKKNKNSLVDVNDQPVNDNAIEQWLSGLGKESYATMFSLDDDTLERGGESILASKGDLGKLLYSATTGVAQLSESLLLMRAETDSFYKKGKRKFELAELKSQLKEIEAERKQLDTEVSGYSKLVKLRVEADQRYESLGAAQDKLKLLTNKLQLKRSAHPRLNAINRLQAEIHPLAEIPDVPIGWFDEVRQLQMSSVEFNTREKDHVQKIAELEDAIAQVELDDAALGASLQWSQIASSHVQYLVAAKNLPDVQQQARLCEHEINNCLRMLDRVGIEQPATLLLNATTQANFKVLIQQHEGLKNSLDTANKELSSALSFNSENKQKYILEGGSVEVDNGVETIKHNSALITDIEREMAAYNSELVMQHRSTSQQIASLQNELAFKLDKLRPWSGNGRELQALNAPHDSELLSLQQTREQTLGRITQAEHSVQTLTKTIEHTRSQQQSFAVTGLIDDAESGRVRRERDEAWITHWQALDAVTAENFERAMRADDAGQAARLHNTEKLAQLGQVKRELFVAEESLSVASKELEQLRCELDDIATDIKQLIHSISPSLSSTMSIDAVSDWLSLRVEALQDVRRISGLERELVNINDQVSSTCLNLSKVLEAACIPDYTVASSEGDVVELSKLLKIAQSAIKQEAVLSGVRDQLIASQHQVRTRRSNVDAAQQLQDQWKVSWKELCASCWLGTNDVEPSTAIVTELLPQLVALEQQMAIESGLNEKIAQDTRVIEELSESLFALASTLSIASDQQAIDSLYETIQSRMDKSIEDQSTLNALQAQKEELLEVQKSNRDIRAISVQSIDRMSTHFSVQSIDEVELKLQESRDKNSLHQRIAIEERELLDLMAVESLQQATDLLAEYNPELNQLELDKLERSAKDIEIQLQEAHTTREQARKAVESVGGDEAVALLTEKRANLLLLMEDKSTQYLQQHLALIAADSALKMYRDNHRSTMMKQASSAFSTISQGGYARLETFQDGATEKLIAIDRDGGTKKSHELSKGTRFQLYLALRVAGYHEYSSSRSSVPFIADDIMETSDDQRAANTFEVLADMARVGQVIYLTHHQHLCDIARSAVPECTIHQLG